MSPMLSSHEGGGAWPGGTGGLPSGPLGVGMPNPGKLLVAGEAGTATAEPFKCGCAVGDHLYLFGYNIAVKLDKNMNVVASKRLAALGDVTACCTDGTHLYIAGMSFAASYWKRNYLKLDLSLGIVGGNRLDVASSNNYPGGLAIGSDGMLWSFGGANGNSSSTYLEVAVLRIDPSTMTLLSNRSYYTSGYSTWYGGMACANGKLLGTGVLKSTKYIGLAGFFNAADLTANGIQSYLTMGYTTVDTYFMDGIQVGDFVYLVGSVDKHLFLVKCDLSMNVVAQRTYGNGVQSYVGQGIALGADGHLHIAAYLPDASSDNAGFLKVDTDMNLVGAFAFGHASYGDYGHEVVVLGKQTYGIGNGTGRDGVSAVYKGFVFGMPKANFPTTLTGFPLMGMRPPVAPTWTASSVPTSPAFSWSNAVRTYSSAAHGCTSSDLTVTSTYGSIE